MLKYFSFSLDDPQIVGQFTNNQRLLNRFKDILKIYSQSYGRLLLQAVNYFVPNGMIDYLVDMPTLKSLTSLFDSVLEDGASVSDELETMSIVYKAVIDNAISKRLIATNQEALRAFALNIVAKTALFNDFKKHENLINLLSGTLAMAKDLPAEYHDEITNRMGGLFELAENR